MNIISKVRNLIIIILCILMLMGGTIIVSDMLATHVKCTLTSDDKEFENDTIIDDAFDKLKVKKGEDHYIKSHKRPTLDKKKKKIVTNSIKKSMNEY